jgi:hypothetical protein
VKDILEKKKAKIDYEQREIVMGDVKVKIDDAITQTIRSVKCTSC